MERHSGANRRRFRKLDATVAPMGVLVGLWWLCERVSQAAGLPLPGGILGLGVLLLLLGRGVLPFRWVSRGAEPLLDHLLLFFVPATMSLLNHPEFLGITGVKILVVILGGVVLVMAGTALVVEWHFRLLRAHHGN